MLRVSHVTSSENDMQLRVLITGSSGFIGQHLVERFRNLGWSVTGIGRRSLTESGYVSHDLAKPLPESLDGQIDLVVHAAARSNPWGTKRQFENDNVIGTKNVIDYCQRNGSAKLVYISSSSVYYRPEHQFNINEDTPLPRRNVNLYATTKRKAEELVQAYAGQWVILRPRAVFGPGDTVLLPRIIRAARQGRLPLLYSSDGPVVGDLIYIDNLIDAIETAATNDDVSGVFNLTNNQPVPILEFLFTVFDRLNIPRPHRRVSARSAMVVAGMLEAFHRAFLPNTEPAITRFGVHVFRYSKTFDVTKAVQQLGQPRVSLDEGLSRTVEWFRQELDRSVAR
jgi:nucleoside-diphosphate-sugar epimerase